MKMTIRTRLQDNTQVVLTTTSQKVQAAIEQVAQDARVYYRSLMPTLRQSASAGQSPRAHKGLLRDRLFVLTTSRSLRMGPDIDQSLSERWYFTRSKKRAEMQQRILPSSGSVPSLLEVGGKATRYRRYRSGKEYTRSLKYSAFPYLEPTRQFAINRFLQLIKE